MHAVLDASDIGTDIPTIPLRLAPLSGLEKYLQPVIAHGKVRYVGEPVAIVLADSRALAEDALEVLNLTIQPLEAVPDWVAAERDVTVRFEQNGTNVPLAIKPTSAMSTPSSEPPTIRERRNFARIVIPRCRWKRAA